MLLFEFDNPLRTSLIAVLSKLKTDIQNGKENSDMSVRQLLDKLKKSGIDELDQDYLYDAVNNKKAPISTFIKNIVDNKVVFRGQKQPVSAKDEDKKEKENEKIVKQMASKGIKSKK